MPKKYIPNDKEKYMCEKHKEYFKKRLIEWKNEIVESNSKGLLLSNTDHEISSPDIVDQASSQTEKSVEMRTLNRQIKLGAYRALPHPTEYPSNVVPRLSSAHEMEGFKYFRDL